MLLELRAIDQGEAGRSANSKKENKEKVAQGMPDQRAAESDAEGEQDRAAALVQYFEELQELSE